MRKLIVMLFLTFPATLSAQIEVRQVVASAPASLEELKATAGPVATRPCEFDSVPASSLRGTTIVLPDSASLVVPRGWRHFVPNETMYGKDVTGLTPIGSSWVHIRRERNGTRGRSWVMYRSGERPVGETCFVDVDGVGAIWTIYPPDPGERNSRTPYSLFGDILTPARRWYRVKGYVRTPEQGRDVASTLTAAMLLQRD